MIVKGNPKRLTIGLWVLAALLILWYNGVAMIALFDQPLVGLSPEARETITKWQRLEMMVASQLKEMTDQNEIDRTLAAIDIKKIVAAIPIKKPKPATVVTKKIAPVKKKKVVLPALNGILAIYDADGNTDHLAIIEGKAREKNSRIGEFKLEKIDSSGVVLTQDKESWFIPAPTVDFSVDASQGAAQ
jgi:hypothetical protein